jgi:hypothetical protein
MTILLEEPEIANWWNEMTLKYSKTLIDEKPAYNAFAENGGMNFYRDNLNIQDLIKLAERPFLRATDEYIYENDLFDIEGDCGAGCTVF